MNKLVFTLLSVVCIACNSNTKQDTVTVNNTTTAPNEFYNIKTYIDLQDTSGFENLALHLFNDGTYSHFGANFYNYGTYVYNEQKKRLILTPTKGFPTVNKRFYKIDPFETNWYIQKLHYINNKLYREVAADEIFVTRIEEQKEKSIFSEELNAWRIKPQQPETKKQIKARTLSYLNFLKLYYKRASKNNFQYITFGWYPQPVRFNYVNTVRMAYDNELDDWNNCFYNKEQAIEAYKLMSGNIRNITLSNYESNNERNLFVISELVNMIEYSE